MLDTYAAFRNEAYSEVLLINRTYFRARLGTMTIGILLNPLVLWQPMEFDPYCVFDTTINYFGITKLRL